MPYLLMRNGVPLLPGQEDKDTPTDFFDGHSASPFARPESEAPRSPSTGLNPFLIPDGFSYNVHLKFLPYRSHAMQLRLLDAYRRQALGGLWQPRWYAIPPDARVPVAGGDTFYCEQRVAKGAVLWGYTFAALASEGGNLIAASVADLRVSLLDVSNGHEITAGAASSRYVIGSAFRANFAAGAPNAGFGFVFMPEPYPVSGQGLIAGTIVNTNASARFPQLVLMLLEPGGSPF